MDTADLHGLAVEAGAGATCGACLQALGVPGQLAVPAGVVLAVVIRWGLEVARPALAAWWAHRQARRRLPPPPGQH